MEFSLSFPQDRNPLAQGSLSPPIPRLSQLSLSPNEITIHLQVPRIPTVSLPPDDLWHLSQLTFFSPRRTAGLSPPEHVLPYCMKTTPRNSERIASLLSRAELKLLFLFIRNISNYRPRSYQQRGCQLFLFAPMKLSFLMDFQRLLSSLPP